MADNKELLLCPACGKEMKKLYIPDNNVNVDICIDGCGGIYFDNRELEKFDEAHENAEEILKEVENRHFAEVDTTKPRICPVCGATMMKQGAANGKVEIDVCAFCGGKFVDAGELQQIRNTQTEPISQKMDDLFEHIYQNKMEKISININGIPGYEKRRDFFTKLASKYIEWGE